LAVFASFARNIPVFGCGFAALGLRGESCFFLEGEDSEMTAAVCRWR
jgi:hypothetical protein